MAPEADDRGALLGVIILGLIWGSAYPVIRYGLVEGATPIAFAAVRYALSAAALAALAAALRVPRPSLRSLGLSAVLGVPILGLYGLFLYLGETTTSGNLASILIGAVPLLTALFALPILPRETLRGTGYLGLIVGFVGVFVLVFPPDGIVLASTVTGPVLVVAAAVSFAFGSVLLRARRPEGENLWGVAVQFGVATLLLAAVLPILEPRAALPGTPAVLGSLLYLVLLPSTAGYALYFSLHHRVGPGRANLVAYVNPVAAIAIGTIAFGEPFVWWEIVGFVLILVGLTLVTQVGRVRRPSPEPTARSGGG